jgi:hypothetical protein
MPAVKDVGEPGAGEPHARSNEAAGGTWYQSGLHMPRGAGASRRPYRDQRQRRLLRFALMKTARAAGLMTRPLRGQSGRGGVGAGVLAAARTSRRTAHS